MLHACLAVACRYHISGNTPNSRIPAGETFVVHGQKDFSMAGLWDPDIDYVQSRVSDWLFFFLAGDESAVKWDRIS